jgi:hypothetical protein
MTHLLQNCRVWILLLSISGLGAQVYADWHSFWHGLHIGKARNHAWPDPFNEADATQVVAPFEVMKNNGWRLHNTVGNELFRTGDGALLASGNRRVEWIATQAPESRRDIFVMQGRTPQETEARVQSVRQTLASLQIPGNPPTVWVTDIEPSTASGAWATQINRTWLQELPPPRLPNTSASGKEGATR